MPTTTTRSAVQPEKKRKVAHIGDASGSAPELLAMLALLHEYGIKERQTLEQVLSSASRPATLPALSDLRFTQYYDQPCLSKTTFAIPERHQHRHEEDKFEDNEHSLNLHMQGRALQDEWDHIFEKCEAAVLNLFGAAQIDGDAQACWVVENKSAELGELYIDARGAVQEGFDHSQCFVQYHVLLSMVSGIVHRVMHTTPLAISFLDGENSPLRTLLVRRMNRESKFSQCPLQSRYDTVTDAL